MIPVRDFYFVLLVLLSTLRCPLKPVPTFKQHPHISAHQNLGAKCLPMSYHADKPFGRRRTDKQMSNEERRHLETIRRDVEQDASGLIRRYLRLSEKVLDLRPVAVQSRGQAPQESADQETSSTRRAA